MRGKLERLKALVIAVSVIGAFFKLMHWPGANMMLIAGLSLLGLIHLALSFMGNGITQKELYIQYARSSGIALTIFGALFKIMHWPGASTILIAGIGGIVLSFAIQFMLTYKGK